MLGPRSSRFYGAALQSGLIDEAGLNACWDLIAPERRTPEAIDRRLARQAIATGRITLWQAQQLLAGRISGYFIDKYILLSLLGRGGMGRVFLARDVRLNRTVALKLLSQERMNNPRAIARFRREAKVGAQLQHENLVRVYDEGESAGILYLVMEHIDGKNVGQTIGELTKIPWPMAARLARQVALGLEHARLKGLIHRDVNPGNILITQDGTAKLTDLGLAIDLNDLDNVTREGATVGTFDYVSPEQAKNSRSVDTRSDLYSLGCTLFHMVAGRVPFPMASLPEKLYAHQLHDPEPLTELLPEVPEGLAEVVRRLMRKLPDERYQTPAEVAQALEPFAIETGWTTTATTNGPDGGQDRSGSGEGPGIVEGSSMGLTAVAPTPPSAEVGGSFLPLDLGPDEPLAGHLHKPPRTRILSPGPEETSAPGGTKDARGDRKPPRRVKIGLVAVLAFAAIVAAGLVAVVANLISSRSGDTTAPPLSGGSGQPGTRRAAPSAATETRPPAPVTGDVVVRFRDGTSEVAANLEAALARAVRDRAEVLLGPGTTVRLTNDSPLRIPDGGVTIRGTGSGPAPTIDFTLQGGQPAVLAGANLKLADLIVTIHAEEPTDAPVWQAERDLTCERCVFRLLGVTATEGEPPAPTPEGPRLILAEGPRLTVTGCLFAGFARPIEFAARPGASATLDQSLFVAGPPSNDAPLGGRTLLVRSAYGGGAGVKLKVTACSTRSRVFLAVDQFSTTSPLAVEVSDSAIWTSALLQVDTLSAGPGPEGAFAPPPAEQPIWATVTQAIQWRGHANRFQISPDETPWARLVNSEPLPEAPASLEAWSKGDRESASQTCHLRFANPPAPGSTPQPGDESLTTDDAKLPGADPSKVGPRS